MQVIKIHCTHCTQFGDCPNRTRLYINYCGSDLKKMNENIRSAVQECRSRRGHLLKKRDFTLHVAALSSGENSR